MAIQHGSAARGGGQRLQQGRFRHAVRGRGHAQNRRGGLAEASRPAQDAERAIVPIVGQNPGRYGDSRHGQRARIQPEDQDLSAHRLDLLVVLAARATRANTTRTSRRCALRSLTPPARPATRHPTKNGWTFRRRNTRPWKKTWEWRSNTSQPGSTKPKASAWRSRPASPTWPRPDRATSTATGSKATAPASGSSTGSTR